MKEIELIHPYKIVMKDGLYGIIDNEGRVLVPCEMDAISNIEDEDIELTYWDDYYCVSIEKDGLFGFFTDNGTFIKPLYDEYAIEPGEGNIHVRKGEEYGIFAAPDYNYEVVEEERSLICESGEGWLDDDEEEDCEFEDHSEEDRLLAELFHKAGYDYAESVWNESYAAQAEPDMKKYTSDVIEEIISGNLYDSAVESIKEKVSEDLAQYMQAEEDVWGGGFYWADDVMLGGAAEFMSPKCLANADIPKVNKKIQKCINDYIGNSYRSLLDVLAREIPMPEDGEDQGEKIVFPPDFRPETSEYSGYSIGSLYIEEVGMHAYMLSADIYYTDDPEELHEEGRMLFYDQFLCISQLLQGYQKLTDPDKKKEWLSDAIDRAIAMENEECYGHILAEHGMHVFSDAKGQYGDYVYVYEDKLNIAERGEEPYDISVKTLTATSFHFSSILDSIKKDINIAYGQIKKKH